MVSWSLAVCAGHIPDSKQRAMTILLVRDMLVLPCFRLNTTLRITH